MQRRTREIESGGLSVKPSSLNCLQQCRLNNISGSQSRGGNKVNRGGGGKEKVNDRGDRNVKVQVFEAV